MWRGLFSSLMLNSLSAAVVAQQTCTVPDAVRIDCHPEPDASSGSCVDRGCCWVPSEQAGAPYCFYSPDSLGYSFDPSSKTLNATGYLAEPYGTAIGALKLEETDGGSFFRFKIFDPKNARHEVPYTLPVSPTLSGAPKLAVAYGSSAFDVKITRQGDAVPIFDSSVGPLLFKDQFLQISTAMPAGSSVYGLGEHSGPFRLDNDPQFYRLSMFARDIAPGPSDNNNLYGVHPFALVVAPDGRAHGIFFYNSSPLEAQLVPGSSLTFRALGGIVDMLVFPGPTPRDVVAQYLAVVGRPYMIPYWTLGFHLCRWGYVGAGPGTAAVVKRMRDYGIPQDVQWNDIDYMERYLDFTYDKGNFSNLPDMVADLHEHGQRYVMIVDPGISNTQLAGTYPPFDEGVRDNVFIRDSQGDVLIGNVWPGDTAYPDFLAPNATSWWTRQVQRFHAEVPFDGLWIDMNEPSNFYYGSKSGCTPSALENPPYLPPIVGKNLSSNTVCMNAQQYKGDGNEERVPHYNVHSLYGHSEAVATAAALRATKPGERPFVLSRSTFAGSGRHASHWLGDNAARWDHLREAISGVLQFNLFGIPLVGPDICGFNGDTTEELCTRWMEAGAFYPFSRNHNTVNARDQDPAAFGPALAAASREALLLRYSLLPYLYTLFYRASIDGDVVASSLMMNFPADAEARGIDQQFMWGTGLLITPVMTEGATSVTGYFPPSARWFDLRSGVELTLPAQATQVTEPAAGGHATATAVKLLKNLPSEATARSLRVGALEPGAVLSSSAPGWATLNAPLNYIPLHVRGGSILPKQQPETTTVSSRRNPFSLLVALDGTGAASGELYQDDGVAIDAMESGDYTLSHFSAKSTPTGGVFTCTIAQDGYNGAAGLAITSVRVVGVASVPSAASSSAHLRGAVVSGHVEVAGGERVEVVATLGDAGVVDLRSLNIPANQPFKLTWVF